MKNHLILVRGVSGAGKSTFAELFGKEAFIISADMYFEDVTTGKYEFDPSRLKHAHEFCQRGAEVGMREEALVVVANTFTQEWEMEPYYALAKKYGYRVFSVIVENRHGGTSVHDVPAESVKKQAQRFEVKLV